MHNTLEKIKTDNTLVREIGFENAGIVYLIDAGLKPGGEIELPPTRYCKAQQHLQELGLSTLLNYTTFKQPANEQIERFLDHEGINYCINNGITIAQNYPHQLLLWKKNPIAPEDAARAYNTRDYMTFGKFVGYPKCCIDEFTNGCVQRYHQSLKKRIDQQGINGIEHLVGIQHVPCSLDCEETKRLGYAQFLKENAPYIYPIELMHLVNRILE